MKTLVFLFLIAMLAMPAFAQPGKCAAPEEAELDKFPIMNGPLSTKEMARLRLAPMTLKQPVVFHNHYRNLRGGCWPLESLSAGTIVLVDISGEIRYKADCGNRLVEVKKPFVPDTPKYSWTDYAEEPSVWSRFWDKVGKAWDSTWGILGSLIGTLLPLLILFTLIGLLGYLIHLALPNRQQGQSDPGQNPPPPAQPLAPVPPAPAPQATPPAPVPGPVAVPSQLFPRRRVVVDLNEDGSERVLCGAQISRVQIDRGEDDGSTIIRISHRL